jgi:hypothetical protein
LIAGWFAAFLFLTVTMGIVATLLVIAERLKPTQENVDSPSHTLAKILFTKSNSVTPPYTITKDGEKRHISFEGYGIFHTKKLFAKQIIKKVLVVFREVASYENDIKQIKPVGDASIEVSKEVCQSIWIKVPIGSAILEDRNNFREGSSLILMGSQEDDGEAITMIVKEFYLHGTDVHGIEINEFIESMDKLDARQNKNSAEKNIAEVKKYFETTIAID